MVEQFEFQAPHQGDQRRCAGFRSAAAGGPEFVGDLPPLGHFPVAEPLAERGVAAGVHHQLIFGSNQRLVVGLQVNERNDEFDEP